MQEAPTPLSVAKAIMMWQDETIRRKARAPIKEVLVAVLVVVPPLVAAAQAVPTLTLLRVGGTATAGALSAAAAQVGIATVVLKQGHVDEARFAAGTRGLATLQRNPPVVPAPKVLVGPRKRVPPAPTAAVGEGPRAPA